MDTVTSIRQRVVELQSRFRQVAAGVEPDALHWRPAPDAWSVAQILAHAAEFQSFFAKDVLHLRDHPGAGFGRTLEHPERLRAVELTGAERLDGLLAAFDQGCQDTLRMLDALQDADLAVEGTHPKFGRRSVAWEIDHFITEHLEKHIGQVERTYNAYLASRQNG
ncbi:MAG: DinB family protein [Alicyclobacillaceae bacterium]|nr:DinB family protein [Alicyclobacillaceae bacterium]